MSRFVYRWTVAWLHFLQPLARTHGRVLGFLSPPRGVSGVHDDKAAPVPLPRLPFWTTLRLLVGGSVQEQFWGESWVNPDTLLQKIADWLRSSRAVHIIELDDGWRQNRDFSVAAGRWVWLDLRALVEEHAGGRCLVRVATSGRLTRAGWFVTSVVGCAAVGLSVGGFLWKLPFGLMAGPTWLALIGALVAAPMRKSVAALRAAVSEVVTEVGLTPINARSATDVRASDPKVNDRTGSTLIP